MSLAWDPESRCLLREDRAQVGTFARSGYTVDVADVSQLTLAEWLPLIHAVEKSEGGTVVVTIEDKDGGTELCMCQSDELLGVAFSINCRQWPQSYIESVLETLCAANEDEPDEVKWHFDGWVAGVAFRPDGRTTRDMFELQGLFNDVLQTGPERCGAIGNLPIDTVLRTLELGGAKFLVGARESAWLEFKSQGYNLSSFASKIELSQDVCRFANGGHAALLLIGFRTRKRNGHDLAEKVTPIGLEDGAEARYRAVIDEHVFPLIDGLQIKQIPVDGGAIIAVCIPAQPDGRKPYMTYGAVVDGKNEGSFISIIERRDEGSRSMGVAELHGLLVAGRALLTRRNHDAN